MPDALSPRPPNTPALQPLREWTVDELCRRFAADDLELAEFERRLDVANRATTPAELTALTADLASAAEPAPLPTAEPAPRRGVSVARRAHQALLAIMGGVTRKGRWTPAQQSTTVAIMGGVELDFREAILPPGETVINCFAFWGGIEIIVPPDLSVDVDGLAIMGGFENASGGPLDPSDDAPRLRITGAVIMGGVDVKVRAVGEPAGRSAMRIGVHVGPRSRFEEVGSSRSELQEWRRELRRQLRDTHRRK